MKDQTKAWRSAIGKGQLLSFIVLLDIKHLQEKNFRSRTVH